MLSRSDYWFIVALLVGIANRLDGKITELETVVFWMVGVAFFYNLVKEWRVKYSEWKSEGENKKANEDV